MGILYQRLRDRLTEANTTIVSQSGELFLLRGQRDYLVNLIRDRLAMEIVFP